MRRLGEDGRRQGWSGEGWQSGLRVSCAGVGEGRSGVFGTVGWLVVVVTVRGRGRGRGQG